MNTAAFTMDAFLEKLHDLARRRFDCAETSVFLRGLHLEPASMEKYLHWKSGGYARNLIHRETDFELLALCWDSGQASMVHGHEGEKCWSLVERGRLLFCNYAETVPRDGNRVTMSEVNSVEGAPGHLDGPADIHSVANPAAFGERAVSLHLYCYPFDECEIFCLKTNTVSRLKLDYDSIGGKPVK